MAHLELEPAVLSVRAAQRRRVRLVRVQHRDDASLVDRLVNVKRRGVDLARALEDVSVSVHEQKVRRGDFAPQETVRHAQEPVVRPRDHDREVVAYPLVHVHLVAEVVRRREVHARGPRRGIAPSLRPSSRVSVDSQRRHHADAGATRAGHGDGRGE
eukprot:29119-Pelagococcus_subviridis.AAC.2